MTWHFSLGLWEWGQAKVPMKMSVEMGAGKTITEHVNQKALTKINDSEPSQAKPSQGKARQANENVNANGNVNVPACFLFFNSNI